MSKVHHVREDLTVNLRLYEPQYFHVLFIFPNNKYVNFYVKNIVTF